MRSSARAIAGGIIAAVAGWILLLAMWAARDFLLLTFLGITFGVTLSGPCAWLAQWRIPRGLSAALLAAGFVAAIAGAGWWIAPAISAQGAQLEAGLPDALQRVQTAMEGRSIGGLTVDVDAAAAALRQYFATRTPLKILFPVVKESLAAIIGAIMLPFIAIYLAAESTLYHAGLLRLVPPRHRDRAAATLVRIGQTLRQWLVARLLAMIAIGVVTGVSLWLIGIPASTALGVLAGALEFIPFFGPIASAIPAIAMGLLVSPYKALWVALLFVGIQHLEGDVVTPLIMRSRIEVPPLLTIVALAVLGVIFGVMGMLVAEPLTATAIVLTRELYVEPMESAMPPP